MSDLPAPRRKLVLKMSMSLDGFVCGPKGETDWIFRTSSEDSRAWVHQTLSEAGVHVMGRRTYDGMATFWPFADTPMAAPMNERPKVVFSRNGITPGTQADRTAALADAMARQTQCKGVVPSAAVLQSWAEPTVAHGDLTQEVGQLKGQAGNYILAHGGAAFARSLVAAGLIDEYRLAIHPILLGQGQALFSGERSPLELRLVSATPFSGGVVAVVHRIAGTSPTA